MIHIYFLPSSGKTFKQTKDYLDKNDIDYQIKSFSKLTIYEIRMLFQLSPNLEHLINRRVIKKINWSMSFNKLLIEIKEKPTMLKSPLIVDYENNIVVAGFNEDRLDIFLRIKRSERWVKEIQIF